MPNLAPIPAAAGALTGRRVRLPVPLLLSPHHTANAVALWALLDVLGGPDLPVTAGREWLAGRLGVSLPALKRALTALTWGHTSEDPTVPDAPAYLVSTVRGKQRTAARRTLRGIPFVDVPEWTIGASAPIVSHASWRLYALLLHKRQKGTGAVKLRRADLAQLLHVRADRLPTLLRPLVAAGMLVALERRGKESILAPVLAPGAAGLAAARAAIAAADAPWSPVDATVDNSAEPVDNPADSVDESSTGHPGNGPAPDPRNEPSPHPQTGPPLVVPPYKTRTNETRRRARASAAPRHAHDGSAAPAASSTRPPAAWCGRCHGPRSRVELDVHTGLPTGEQCHRCATPPADETVAA